MKLSRFAVVGFLAVLYVSSVSALTVLYSQPINQCCSDGGLFSNDPTQLAADLFSIAGGGAINQAVWYGAALSGLAFGTFNAEFYASSAGSPGAELYKFTAAPTIVDTGMLDPYGVELYQFTLNIPVFDAAAGVNYFFSASDSGSFNFVWENSDLTSGGFYSDNGAAGPWNNLAGIDPVRASQAFTLLNATGVPEPSTFLLFGPPLVLLGLVRRRRLNRHAQLLGSHHSV